MLIIAVEDGFNTLEFDFVDQTSTCIGICEPVVSVLWVVGCIIPGVVVPSLVDILILDEKNIIVSSVIGSLELQVINKEIVVVIGHEVLDLGNDTNMTFFKLSSDIAIGTIVTVVI